MDFEPEIFVLHAGANDLSLNELPKEICEAMLTLVESLQIENDKIIIFRTVCRADSFREKVKLK